MNLAHQNDKTAIDENWVDKYCVDNAVQVDLLRRAGAFERAAKICEGVLTHTRYTGVGPIMAFELELCRKRDAKAHTMDEVPDRSRKWG